MNAVNYDTLMREEMDRAKEGSRLLLHCCCAPCSTYCLQTLHEKFRTTVYFYNPNLDTEEEFRRRRQEQVRLLHETGWGELLECTYSNEDFEEIAKGRETANVAESAIFSVWKKRRKRQKNSVTIILQRRLP